MFEINTLNSRPSYDPMMVLPMREEVTRLGIKELHTPAEVDEELKSKGTVLVFVNSVCGCAAGSARPGLALAMQHGTLPDKVVSVFAGMEKDAVMQARSFFTGYAPSSPQFALLRDGQIIAMLERWQIERQHPQTIAAALIQMFNTHCVKEKA